MPTTHPLTTATSNRWNQTDNPAAHTHTHMITISRHAHIWIHPCTQCYYHNIHVVYIHKHIPVSLPSSLKFFFTLLVSQVFNLVLSAPPPSVDLSTTDWRTHAGRPTLTAQLQEHHRENFETQRSAPVMQLTPVSYLGNEESLIQARPIRLVGLRTRGEPEDWPEENRQRTDQRRTRREPEENQRRTKVEPEEDQSRTRREPGVTSSSSQLMGGANSRVRVPPYCGWGFNFGGKSKIVMVMVHLPQVRAAIWLVGLPSILAPAGKLSPKKALSKDICHFLKKKEASPLCCQLLCWIFDRYPGSEQSSHWRRCWRLRQLQESYSKALESHLARTRERVHHGHPPTLDWLDCTCCWATKTTSTTEQEFPASH